VNISIHIFPFLIDSFALYGFNTIRRVNQVPNLIVSHGVYLGSHGTLHFLESRSIIASAYVAGSSLSNNNISRAARSLADLRGCGAASLAMGISTCSTTLPSLVEALQDTPSVRFSPS
jgi:hypothetical protein